MKNINLIPATDDDLKIVLNLIKYYVYDMSKSAGWECNDKGVFDGCDDAREYWQNQHPDTPIAVRWSNTIIGHPFIIKLKDNIAGFVLVKEFANNKIDFEIGEFFIIGKYQGKGIGKIIALQLFDKFQGNWLVSQLMVNEPAIIFWEKIIFQYTKNNFTESQEIIDEWNMNCIRFNSRIKNGKS